MGKVRTRIIGVDDIEEKQKKEQKKKLYEKKIEKRKDARSKPVKAESPEVNPKEDKKEVSEKVQEKKKVEKKAKAKVRGKKYQKAKKQVETGKKYSLKESISILKKIKYTKFDEAVELHVNLNKKGLRGEVSLPNSIGKTTRAVVVNQKVLDDIENGKIEFDVLITEPSFMPKLAKHAKVLGPRGLMPSPKTGTISDKPAEVLKKYTGGFIKWKSEQEAPLLHQMVGKISHEDKKLEDNVKALLAAVGKEQVESVYIKTTMSPGLKLDVETL